MSREFDFERLVELCQRTHEETRRSAARAIDRSLVVRNWLFGWYVVEYEQHGADRAEYGAALISRLAAKLAIRGCSSRSLALSCKFYRLYPEILQTASAKSTTASQDETPSSRVSPSHRAHRFPPRRIGRQCLQIWQSDSSSAGPTTPPSSPLTTRMHAASTRSRPPTTVGAFANSSASSTVPCTNRSRSAATGERSAVFPVRDK